MIQLRSRRILKEIWHWHDVSLIVGSSYDVLEGNPGYLTLLRCLGCHFLSVKCFAHKGKRVLKVFICWHDFHCCEAGAADVSSLSESEIVFWASLTAESVSVFRGHVKWGGRSRNWKQNWQVGKVNEMNRLHRGHWLWGRALERVSRTNSISFRDSWLHWKLLRMHGSTQSWNRYDVEDGRYAVLVFSTSSL